MWHTIKNGTGRADNNGVLWKDFDKSWDQPSAVHELGHCTPSFTFRCTDTYKRFVKRQKQIALNNPNNLAIQRAALVSAQELVTLREEAQKYHVSTLLYTSSALPQFRCTFRIVYSLLWLCLGGFVQFQAFFVALASAKQRIGLLVTSLEAATNLCSQPLTLFWDHHLRSARGALSPSAWARLIIKGIKN